MILKRSIPLKTNTMLHDNSLEIRIRNELRKE